MHRSVRPLRVSAALVAGLAMLVACGTNSSTTSSATSVAQTSAPAHPAGAMNAIGVPGAVPNDTRLRKTVTLTSCGQVPGGWRASGTAANHGATAADYTVTVFFTTPRDTVIGTGGSRVHIDADATVEWSVTGEFAADATTQCVLRGVG